MLWGRASYLGPACHKGHVPVEAVLGLSAGKLTPGAEEVATRAGPVGSFAAAAGKLLPKRAGLRLGESMVERTTAAAGTRLGPWWADEPSRGPALSWRCNRDAKGRTVADVRLDATGVGLPGEGGPRAEGRLASVGKVFNPGPEPAHGVPKPDPPKARYPAGLRDLEQMGTRRRRPAAQGGRDRAEQGVALTEGGAGPDEFLDVPFPRGVRIRDFSHAAEHLGDLAKASLRGDAAAAQERTAEWSPQRKPEGGAALLAARVAWDLKGRSPAAWASHRLGTGSVRHTLHRRDYPRYRREGWQIGWGHIEAACKTVVK